MAKRPPKEQRKHDEVVRAAVQRWKQVEERGMIRSINPGDEENQHAGAAWNPRYPDVLIWMPEEPGADHGTAMIMEEVETESTVNEEEVDQWRDYAQLYGYKFNLVVPKEKAAEAEELVERFDVTLTAIVTYALEGERLRFEEHRVFAGGEAE